MSAEGAAWDDEHLLDHRRRLRTGMFVSLAIHGLAIGAFAVSPPAPMAPAPEYLSVDLVAPMPLGAPKASPAVRPSPPAPAAEPPAPAPEPPAPAEPPAPPPPAPPVTKAPVQVLPEETPGQIREAKPKPEPEPEPEKVAKVVPKPVAKPKVKQPPTPKPPARRRGQKEEQLSLEDAMAAFENELGKDETADLLKPQGRADGVAEAEPTAASRPGRKASPEQVRWDNEVSRRIRDRFPTFAQYSGRGIAALIEVNVSATGELVGTPKLVATSGDLDFDSMVLAIVQRAAPLPPPPKPGRRTLNMTSE